MTDEQIEQCPKCFAKKDVSFNFYDCGTYWLEEDTLLRTSKCYERQISLLEATNRAFEADNKALLQNVGYFGDVIAGMTLPDTVTIPRELAEKIIANSQTILGACYFCDGRKRHTFDCPIPKLEVINKQARIETTEVKK
jgi:acid phosphatase class B